jgi:steroid 5-alpha reductase family enzyme
MRATKSRTKPRTIEQAGPRGSALPPDRVFSALWPACVGALAVLYANVGNGSWARRSTIAWMMGSWGARLTVQALYTGTGAPLLTSLPPITSYSRLLAAALFFSVPALIAANNPASPLAPVEIAAAVLWMIAFAGETTADRQLLRFAARPENAGLVCRSGIWRLVPRAHAVCEGLIWTAFALFAFASPWGWIAFACPVAMLYVHVGRRG